MKMLILAGALAASVGLTACSSWGHRDPGRTAGRAADDQNISRRIETSMRQEPVYKFNDVDVKTYNGVVQLSGFVLTDAQKQRAEEIARHTPGAAQVVDNIVLKETENPLGVGGTVDRQQNTVGHGTNAPVAPVSNTETNL